jgi:hypothetical protein
MALFFILCCAGEEMLDLVKQGAIRRKFTKRGTWNTAKGPFLYLTPEKAAKAKALVESANETKMMEKAKEIEKRVKAKEKERSDLERWAREHGKL